MECVTEQKFYQHHLSKCLENEKYFDDLARKYEAIENNDAEAVAEETKDKALLDLISENKKLKYRIHIMKQSLMELEKSDSKDSLKVVSSKSGSSMICVLEFIESLFCRVIHRVYPNVGASFSAQIQVSKVADYQCSAPLSLSKLLKRNPKDIGRELLENMESSAVISKFDLSGPGFINIFLNKEFICSQISSLMRVGVIPPVVEKKRVVVDFSSPNIAKEMHVGHLRSTIIGESICRLLEFLGHSVARINHLGDWGTQFGMLIAHLMDKFPDFATKTPAVADLQAFYKESKLRFDEDPDFKKRAYEAVVKLQSKQPEYYHLWQRICQNSLNNFDKIYERLDIRLTPRGESFYQNRMEKLVAELEERGLLSLEEGRKVLYAKEDIIPLTMVKSDGGFTYDTSDLACIAHRIEEKGDWLIYVVDAGQASHLRSVFSCAEAVGIWDPRKVRVDHVAFGVVLGEDKKKFKTRSGDTVKLVDLLDEGVERAESALRERERDSVLSPEEFEKAKEAVAYGCIKYADLCHDRTRDYVFSFERMLDFRGNTAAYLLYALTRIRSIVRNSGLGREVLLKELEGEPLHLAHDKEWKLAKTLLKLPDTLVRLTHDLHLHPLCEYLYEISTVFTEFYDACYCIEKESSGRVVSVNTNRLVLCEATAAVMQKCFHILAIQSLDKM